MPSRSQQVVEGYDERRGLHVSSRIVGEVSGEVIFHIVKVHAKQVEIVLADFPHQLVDFPGSEHRVVTLTVPDGYSARVGEEFGQFLELLFR